MEFRKTAKRTHRITVYTISNPEKIEKDLGRDRIEKKDNHHHIKGFQVRNKEDRRSICVYCSAESHRSIERDKVKTIQERVFVTTALTVIILLPSAGAATVQDAIFHLEEGKS